MYKRILLAIDGSDLARHAAQHGLKLAKSVGARVIAVYASPPFETPAGFEFVPAPLLPFEVYEEGVNAAAKRNLGQVATAAKKLEVPCKLMHVRALAPDKAVVDVARKEKCDLIVVGSHGYGSARQLLLGSTSTRILAHCDIPVLVHREKHKA